MSKLIPAHETLDDRNVKMSEDEPRSVYVPVRERPENTHIGWGGDDPAEIDSEKSVATFDPTESQ